MNGEDKPFICYRGGGGIKITPCNAAGWRAFGLWMVFPLAMIARCEEMFDEQCAQ